MHLHTRRTVMYCAPCQYASMDGESGSATDDLAQNEAQYAAAADVTSPGADVSVARLTAAAVALAPNQYGK